MTDLFEAASLADIAEARTGVLSTLAASAALPPVQRSAVQAHAYTAMARLGLLPNSPATRAAIEDCQDKIKCMFEAGAVDLGVAAGQVEALRILLEIALARNDDRGGPIEATINAILDDLLSVQGVSDMDSQLLYNVLAADFEWADRAELTPSGLRTAVNAANRVRGARPAAELDGDCGGLPCGWLGADGPN